MSTVPVKSYRKSTVERRRLYLDYSCWLEDLETLTDFQVTVIPYTEEAPIVVSADDNGILELQLFLQAT